MYSHTGINLNENGLNNLIQDLVNSFIMEPIAGCYRTSRLSKRIRAALTRLLFLCIRLPGFSIPQQSIEGFKEHGFVIFF